ncbi:MAG: TetR/AcrR family transcriptional regulator [Bacteriovoracaceae bacterium]|nr:TetR/AcrR family transcriptional regulator [Bacteriovoracaceae bacterium]
MSTEQKSRELPDLILLASIRLFAKHGYDGVSVRMICDESGCNLSAISKIFGGKTELYLACLQHSANEIIGMMNRHFTSTFSKETFEASMRGFLVEFLDHINTNDEYLEMLLQEMGQNFRNTKGKLLDQAKMFHQRLADILKSGQDWGVVRSDLDIHTLTNFFVHIFFYSSKFKDVGQVLFYKSLREADYRKSCVDTWCKMILNK